MFSSKNGKTQYDLAWAVYDDLKFRCPDEFQTAEDSLVGLQVIMQCVTLAEDAEEVLERQVFDQYIQPNKDEGQ